MKRIFVPFFSALILSSLLTISAQDTLNVQKTLIFGAELIGPVYSRISNNNNTIEGYISFRKSHKYYLTAEAGYSAYSYSQYNYDFSNSGVFLRLGTDINFIKPREGLGNHYAGIGIKYGLSVFSQETPWLKFDNYWGTTEASIDPRSATGHFIQASGSIKAELFKNILIGWTIRANLLLFHTAGKDNRPLEIPGMGISDGSFRPSFAFHIAWILPVGNKDN